MVTEWIISGNPKYYDVVNAFRDLGTVDWKQSTNVSEGDIVYIYVSGNIQSIGLKCVARKVDKTKPTIDDRKYDISGEYDGSYGRYMELEMINEFEGDLFTKPFMTSHGFSSPQSPVRVTPQLKEYLDLVQRLQSKQELDPDSHDGSYELIRETVNAYANMDDLSQIDYKDLNLIYLMAVGTWKQKIPAKKNTINASHLPEDEKKRLVSLLDAVWKKAEAGEYSNQEAGRTSIGMFGTGFFTFQGKTDDESPREFIKMCIDIKDMDDEDAILDRCGLTLTDKFHGMKAASASMVLHCLKPTVFPIFNSNMGADNMFVYLGVDMKWKTEIYSYIKNTRSVKAFRDKNFKVKNYRIFDMAAWDIGLSNKHTSIDYLGVMDYLENNREIPYSNPDAEGLDAKEKNRLLDVKNKGQAAIAEMKKMVELCKENFSLDKCESMSWLDGSNTKTRKYLWAQMKYNSYGTRPESISLFVDMSEETQKARYRFSLELKNDASDKAAVAQYHKHLDIPMQPESTLVYMSGSNEFGHPVLVEDDQETIKARIADGTYKKVQICRVVEWDEELTNDDVENAMLEAVQELIPYYEYVLGIEKIEYWPSLEEYDPGITKEQWAEMLNNPEITLTENLRMFKAMLELGGESTCANLAEIFGGSAASYNGLGRAFGERVHKETGCPLCADEDRERFYTIPFVGRNVTEKGKNRYSWKLRDELKEALEDMDLSEIDINLHNSDTRGFDKNMILYGPPGTGKTYNTAIYAVSICDPGFDCSDYEKVMERYNQLKAEGRIAFTTFHQSYGYEEFIEGIKPVLGDSSDDVGYTIEDGVFKAFCKSAELPDEIEVDHSVKIWKVTLKSGDRTDQGNDLKAECFKTGKIRFNWKTRDEETGTNNIWLVNAFNDRMNIGDFVVSYAGKSTDIDAIGRITGEAVYDPEKESFRWSRDVEWLDVNSVRDIRALNGNKYLGNDAIQELKRVSLVELLKGVNTVNASENDKPYVFIIDEINRGNISKIFGELITLIEGTKRKGTAEAASAILPYSGEEFSVPNNVYILGTMNTADRSIALMDTALRRRFQFEEMMPHSQVLRDIGADIVEDAGVTLDVAAMLDTINKRIEFLFDREHTIGHAFFTGLKDDPTVTRLASIFKKSVIPLLQEYFYEDYSKIMLVLGDNGKEEDEHKFILATETKANLIFRGDTSDVDIPDYSYKIQDSAFYDIKSYIEITG